MGIFGMDNTPNQVKIAECKEPVKNQTLFKPHSFLIGAFTTAAISMSTELVKTFMEALVEASKSPITQAGFFFAIAFLMHSRGMKKEIRANFESLTTAIDNASKALRDDLHNQGNKLDNLAERVSKLETTTTQKEN